MNVSPKGIEIIDRATAETLQQVSIYRISNCSADPTHSNVFAFISSPQVTNSGGEGTSSGDESSASAYDFPSPDLDGLPLTCHVFLCPKRKMAQNISLTVARSFERAFDIWKSISHRRLIEQARRRDSQTRLGYSPSPRPDLVDGGKEGRDEQPDGPQDEPDEEKVMNLLIDLNADFTDIRKSYLQNTWVSFEETEHLMSNLHKNAIRL